MTKPVKIILGGLAALIAVYAAFNLWTMLKPRKVEVENALPVPAAAAKHSP